MTTGKLHNARSSTGPSNGPKWPRAVQLAVLSAVLGGITLQHRLVSITPQPRPQASLSASGLPWSGTLTTALTRRQVMQHMPAVDPPGVIWTQQANSGTEDSTTTSIDEPMGAQVLQGALGLGDVITLASGQEPAMPAMARAEQILQRRSGDPLAAIPIAAREPMRRLLAGYGSPTLRARQVILPISKAEASKTLALVQQDSGLIDVYGPPLTKATTAVLNRWLPSQPPPPAGQLQPLLIELIPQGADP